MKLKQIKKLHKVKIHHNRWLAWAIAISIISGILLVGYIKIGNTDLETEGYAIASATENWKQYSNSSLGFSLNHPPKWVVFDDATRGINFLDKSRIHERVLVRKINRQDEAGLRASLNIVEQGTTVVNLRVSLKLINKISSQVSETVILLPYEGKIFVIRGMGREFNKILSSFTIIN